MAKSEEPEWPHLVSIGPESVTQLKHLVHTAYVVFLSRQHFSTFSVFYTMWFLV